ncbi:hypothetical protein EVAR_68593_1 [Eumeta japonica]|uniref:DUF5641 domain-containing protein n=1 Tax=Eumeta variegata TaxID=151549 RepID=A0A4C2A446_EUMVA|nr:hypothetical protein EVAR_68593_1 [Eumeta japonica]
MNEPPTKSRPRIRRKRTLAGKNENSSRIGGSHRSEKLPIPTSDSTCKPYTSDCITREQRQRQRPFTYVGLDNFGPYNVLIGRQHQKRYVALFTCLTSRAVHLEVAGRLSADSATLANKRMMARREDRREAAAQEASARAIDWRYIPLSAPFMGGAWERLVQSIKRALAVTLHERYPREEVFATLLLETEYTVPEYLPTLQHRRKPVGRDDPLAVGDIVIVVDKTLPRNTWVRRRVTATYSGKDGVVRVANITTSTDTLRRPTKKLVVP